MKQGSLFSYFSSSKKSSQINTQNINTVNEPKLTPTQPPQPPNITYYKAETFQSDLGLDDFKDASQYNSKRRLKRNIEDDDEPEEKFENTEENNDLIFGGETLQSSEKNLSAKDKGMKKSDKEQDKTAKKVRRAKSEKVPKSNQKEEIDIIDQPNIFEEKRSLQIDDFEESTPLWARPGSSKDKQLRLHGTEDADPTTLFIPDVELKNLTSSMAQYWKIKSENFDKVIFFKLGKFYELFYEDALVGHRHLDLNFMGKKMHAGFPERAVNKYAKQLVDKGFKVAIVDQTETPDQMEKRIRENKKSGKGPVQKVVLRELTSVLTIGTLQEEIQEEGQTIKRGFGDEKYLVAIRKYICSSKKENYGIALLESQTNVITLAFVENNDMTYEHLKTLLMQMKPKEVVLDSENIPLHDPITKMLRSNILNCSISKLKNKGDNWDNRKAIQRLESLGACEFPQKIREHFINQPIVMDALSGLFSFLHQILILEKVMQTARYEIYEPAKSRANYMVLDSQALVLIQYMKKNFINQCHLEIFETNNISNNTKDNSLFGCIDRTVTPGGKRLLKKWLTAPLFNRTKIIDRQNAVCDFMNNHKERDAFRQSAKQHFDLERLCSRIYSYSVQTQSKAIYYENFSQLRLKEFKQLTQSLRQIQKEIEGLMRLKEKLTSQRLVSLLTYTDQKSNEEVEDNQGLLPKIDDYLDEFENYIQWKQNVPEPIEGILPDYDAKKLEIKAKEQELDEYLEEIRSRFNHDKSINYAHAKHRYELEIPIKYVQKHKPDDFEFTSSKKDFSRFITKELKDMVLKYNLYIFLKVFDLEKLESELKDLLTKFVIFVFKNFQQHFTVWDTFLSIFHEIDVLCSLSVWSSMNFVTCCRPKITESNQPELRIVNGSHPCLIQLGVNYIPNTVTIGGDEASFLMITGPNMGGKSTTLRMVCILTILAQVGCMVPCESMILTPVDRIFTRLGAQDMLMDGKSTFYLELEETLIPIQNATSRSLFIVDELGRGTSTYDGVAIAYAVMKQLATRIRCCTMFSTHFRVLVEEARMIENIANFHMACYIEEESDHVVFLYKLKPGDCPASFGINVAKAVGIDDSIIKTAKIKANFFENNLGLNLIESTLKEYNENMKFILL